METSVPVEVEEEETVPVPAQSMADLIHERRLPLSDLYHDDEIPCAPFGVSGMY